MITLFEMDFGPCSLHGGLSIVVKCVSFCTTVAKKRECCVCKPIKYTSSVTVVSQSDRPKSIHNPSVIEFFRLRICVIALFFVIVLVVYELVIEMSTA